MFGSDIKQLVVLDELRDKLEMIDSDIIPETVSHPVVTGIENVPTSISSRDGTSYQATYTTFPLSPLNGRVNFIKDCFLNFSIDVSFTIFIGVNIPVPIYLAVGPRDTSSIFNQLQLMIDNNVIWNTTYHQIESAIDMAGLPASVVDHSNNYATIDKLLNYKDTPMKIIEIPADIYMDKYNDSSSNFASRTACYRNYKLTYDFTIDLNRLCVPLSNIDFITSNMGNLRLRTYLNNFHESFYYFQLPQDYVKSASNASTLNQVINLNSIVAMNPITWGTVTETDATHYTLSNSNFLINPINTIDTLAEGTPNTVSTAFNGAGTVGGLSSIQTLLPIQFIKHYATNSTNNFMQVTLAEICQTCFDLEESSWNKLCEYFGSIGKVILPIQAWSTNLFNNGTIDDNNPYVSSTLLANVPGNNITDVVVTCCPSNAQSCIMNPYLSNIQALLDGKPLNNVPYDKVNNRAIQDFTNACVDTDREEINTDYLYSLQFPPLISASAQGAAATVTRDKQQYFYDVGTVSDFNYFATYKSKNGMGMNYVKNPNLFMYIFETALPCSFHTGACIIENTNRQALFRLTSNGSQGNSAALAQRFYKTNNAAITISDTANYTGVSAININGSQLSTPLYPSMPNTTNTNSQFNISCLCDECIVLDYDSTLNTCTGGYISYAKPFLSSD